jgi:aspartyl-tRNA(Asn)/glutamyl-tRNA(Gln) amidotransferase subunit B
MHPDYISVIGLEIHAQLATHAKIYCPEAAEYGAMPNTRVSPVSLGLPGALPTLNEHCVELAIKMGLATGSSIAQHCYFARKNYFYPDLPKGYQISQDKTPICLGGSMNIRLKDGTTKRIGITRIHIEEDAGKSMHDQDMYDTLIDLNRAGVGLIEIVSEPDMRTAEEAMAYITEIRKLVRYLDICDGNMEEGSLRCDCNVSVMKKTDTKFGTRTETKNMNSISNVGRAIAYEIERQIELLERGERVIQQTRTWDAVTGTTMPLRDKESADDYRYFPEPDIQPLALTDAYLERIRVSLPELPEALFDKYTNNYRLPDWDAGQLTETKEFANYYEALLHHTQHYKTAANWMIGPVKTWLNERGLEMKDYPLAPEALAGIIELVEAGKVSHSAAKDQLLPILLNDPSQSPAEAAAAHNLLLNDNSDELRTIVQQVLADNPEKVQTYLNGKDGLLGFFVGQVMKLSGGKADPKMLNTLVIEEAQALRVA